MQLMRFQHPLDGRFLCGAASIFRSISRFSAARVVPSKKIGFSYENAALQQPLWTLRSGVQTAFIVSKNRNTACAELFNWQHMFLKGKRPLGFQRASMPGSACIAGIYL
jgi:hypothetical protein